VAVVGHIVVTGPPPADVVARVDTLEQQGQSADGQEDLTAV
jgi:hypothetical protein